MAITYAAREVAARPSEQETPWRPWGGAAEEGGLPILFESPKTALQRRAVELRAEAEKRRAYCDVIEQEWQDATNAVALAQRALEDAESRAVEQAAPVPVEVRDALRRAIDAADRDSFQRRANTARDLAKQSLSDYQTYIEQHGAKLASELRDDCDEVAASYVAAVESFERTVAPIRERHNVLRAKVCALVGRTDGIHPQDVPDSYGVAPYPTNL